MEAQKSQIDLKKGYGYSHFWSRIFTVAAKLKELACTLSEVSSRAQRVNRKYFWLAWLLEDLDYSE